MKHLSVLPRHERLEFGFRGRRCPRPYGLAIACGGTSGINVDLSQLVKESTWKLATGDSVVVTGTVTQARDRVIATSVQGLPS